MPTVSEPTGGRVPGAAARTVAAGTARLLAAWCTGSPLPEAPDRRCDGVTDFAARRADAALPAGVSVPSGPYRALSRMPAEVWLDAAGLARRISVSSDPAAAPEAQVWSIVELWDFGVAADITPPGPDEVLTPGRDPPD